VSKKIPQPFFVKARKIWRVQIHGRQFNLGPIKAEAWKKYHELMIRPPEVASDLVAGVIEGYLDWCQRWRSPRTFAWYKQHLQSFVDSLNDPTKMTLAELKPFHVQRWVDSKPGWGDNHRRGGIVAI
jgi:hypothetical protein